jgi:hypothetical protein
MNTFHAFQPLADHHRQRWMKPHLKRLTPNLWLCEGRGLGGHGATARDAYRMWQRNAEPAWPRNEPLPVRPMCEPAQWWQTLTTGAPPFVTPSPAYTIDFRG